MCYQFVLFRHSCIHGRVHTENGLFTLVTYYCVCEGFHRFVMTPRSYSALPTTITRNPVSCPISIVLERRLRSRQRVLTFCFRLGRKTRSYWSLWLLDCIRVRDHTMYWPTRILPHHTKLIHVNISDPFKCNFVPLPVYKMNAVS